MTNARAVLSNVCDNLYMPAASIRARVRAEMTAEIKAIARQHLKTDGANLSLRAVARDMGMVSSALYRYFASRDELLTALILDAYNSLADTVEAADAAVTDRTRLRDRWLASARAVRSWALATPAEYALLYGSPVPGYAAPQETAAAATRIALVLVRILADGHASGALTAGQHRSRHTDEAVRADLAKVRDDIAPGLPEGLLLLGMTGWTHLFGTVSFELFGQLNNVIGARDEFFDDQMQLMADLLGF
jgi:AcrR family transcriptional regulator